MSRATAPLLRGIMPGPPPPNPSRSPIQAFLAIRRNLMEMWDDAAYEADIQSGPFLGRQQFLLNQHDAIRQVLVTNIGNYRRAPSAFRTLEPLFGNGLLTAEGEDWRRQRRIMAPAMAPRFLTLLSRHVVEASEREEDKLLSAAGEVELLPVMQALTLRIAAQSMFSLEVETFAPLMRDMLVRYGMDHTQPRLLDLLVPQASHPDADRTRAEFRTDWHAMFEGLIAGRLAQASDPGAPRDFFDLLANARDPETGEAFGPELLRDEVATMMLAGHETTASTLFWACYCCARLPDMQERIAAEAAPLDLSAANAKEALPHLTFTRAVIDEALRLYPPAFLIVREAIEADRLAGHEIPPGSLVSVSPWVLGRHRRHWAEAEVFDPARFLPGAPAPSRYSYIPFGVGPRTCIGAQFALIEATLVLARLVRRARLQVANDETVLVRGLITTQPDRPVPFRITPRDLPVPG